MHKNNSILIVSFCLSLLLCGTAFAFEVEWPTIPGAPTLTSNSDIGEFTGYFYAMFVAIGTLVATVVLIMAGVELLTTHDIAKVKPKMIGAIIGIFVLVVPYSLLNLINTNINQNNGDVIDCDDTRICVIRKITKTTTIAKASGTDTKTEDTENEEMSISSMPRINESKTVTGSDGTTTTISKNQIITIKHYKSLQNIVGFSEEEYKGTAKMIYADSPDNDALDKDIPSAIVISGADYKSIKIVDKYPRAFFYDTVNYGVTNDTPISTDIGFYSLAKKTINSIDIVNPYKKEGKDFIGLLFNKIGYRIKCAAFYHDVPDITTDILLSKIIPEKDEGSVKIYQRDKEYLSGSKFVLTIYNNTSCADRSLSEKNSWAENRKCEITFIANSSEIPTTPSTSVLTPDCDTDKYTCRINIRSVDTIVSPQLIEDACPNFTGLGNPLGVGEEVLSFRLSSSGGALIFLDNYETCNVWELDRVGAGESDCNRVNAGGMNPDSSFRPTKVLLIPYGGRIKD